MNLLYAIPLLLVLLGALVAIRRVIRRRALRRQKARRGRGGRPGPKSFVPLGTKRSQMRTDDDPTTVMERITETKPPAGVSRKNGK